MTTLQHVELGVLGPLQVRQYGLPVSIPGAKPRALLTMLALHGSSVVSADVLAELLWGDHPPRTAAKALQTHISALRRTLGDNFVLTAGAGWTLSTTEIDASRYQAAGRTGREALAAGDVSQAVVRFEEALTLWRGVPELPDSPRGMSEKTRWIEDHAALVEDRADALLATGRAAEIVGELEAAIADAPLRERRWAQLMLALYRAGRQGDALGAYQRARSLLADELGVDPGPDLRRLEAAIVAQDVALEMPEAQQLPTVTRAVTFLLTDIEGSTAAWEADATAMAAALARHDEIVEQVVTSRGGRLVKTRGEGDATFSVFDRPSGAAAAAIELQEAIRHERWALGEPMRIRVALHTGEVELRDGDYFGRAVNRAARLRSLAAGGQVLCSGATAELVIDSLADDVVLADLGMRQLRNLARPEHVFELRLLTADDTRASTTDAPMERPGMPPVLAGPGPFVGRSHELERLRDTWQATLHTGTQAVLIAGEPGVGKTRLAGEWSRQAYDDDAVVLYGRCDEDLGAPYQPFAEALRSLVPCLGSSRLRGLRGIEALLPLVPGLADVLPDLAAPPRADPDTERYALFDGVVALLGTASASAPIVLVLDDLHWAAKPTLLLLRHLLRFGEQARVQIVGTYRSTDLDRSHPLAAMLADLHRDGSATRIQLSGLDQVDVSTYVSEAGYDDEELAQALAAVTGGNPFFLIEALRHVDESGGRWDSNTLPQGVREAVSRRLARLPAETNKALAAAAVVGSRFALDMVEQVMGEDLVDALDEACKAGIVIEEPGGRYRFNHALVRQSLLAELPSVRRMRLHQRIATAMEDSPRADDELLAELAYHYFECAWAGNAAKAVEYCRRAADQAMARLSYEGAAELYDRALHALDELDDELPDREDLQGELLIARCEALLAAGDVGSASGTVAQLQETTRDSVRLAAWGVCFAGQLSMLTDPERLEEIDTALASAADQLAALDDAAGEAKAHTVRASCLARLGHIADCETTLDHALTAARRARDHRRVNAVLAGAPLAALWGPNPVPRAGGRCLDVVRLLRITTGSPVVEATSTRCQAVLDALRGRAPAGRSLIESARRTLTELGMRHSLLEVDQFAGIVELIADDPAAAVPHLRRAYDGFRRMGVDADTAETAALLARACLALGRDAESNEFCRESEYLAGHALKPSIAWRAVRAQLLAREGAYSEARRVAQEAVAVAENTDLLVDHGDACLALATVLSSAGDVRGAQEAAEEAIALYNTKGAAALADRARDLVDSERSPVVVAAESAVVDLDNACVRTIALVDDAVGRQAWDELERFYSSEVVFESRRKIVGHHRVQLSASQCTTEARRFRESGMELHRRSIVAVRADRLALTRFEVGGEDMEALAPRDEMLQLFGLDDEGRCALLLWFDIEDIDAAIAELDAAAARLETPLRRIPLENAASRLDHRCNMLFAERCWDEITALWADNIQVADRRRGLRREVVYDRDTGGLEMRGMADLGLKSMTSDVVAIRGDRLALCRTRYSGRDRRPEAFHTEILRITELDVDGRCAASVAFDIDDFDAAVAELDARYLAGEAAPYEQTWSVIANAYAAVNRHEFPATTSDWTNIDHRRGTGFAPGNMDEFVRATWTGTPDLRVHVEVVHRLTDFGTVVTVVAKGTAQQGFEAEWRVITVWTVAGDLINRCELFDEADLNAALARFDELAHPVPQPSTAASRAGERLSVAFAARDWAAMAGMLADDFHGDDRREALDVGLHGRNTVIESFRAAAEFGIPHASSTVVATRGERLILSRVRYSVSDEDPHAFHIDLLQLLETDAEERIVGLVIFDSDDVDSAIAELDARYLAGEGAAHAQTWSTVARSYAAISQQRLPALSPGCVSRDHRRAAAFAPDELSEYIQAGWNAGQDLTAYVHTIHRLNDVGAVVTLAAQGVSRAGFSGAWQDVAISMVEDGLISRCELFDAADLEAALARFDELARPTSRIENAASRADDRANALFTDRRWDDLDASFADGFRVTDRRHGLHLNKLMDEAEGTAAGEYDRAAALAMWRAVVELGVEAVTADVAAIRGERLALARVHYAGSYDEPHTFHNELLRIAEVDADGRIIAYVIFDPDDFDAAIAELEARYLAAEAAAHARTWQAVINTHAAFNRRELPTPPPDTVDHRPLITIETGDPPANVRAIWGLTSDLGSHIEAVHRLGDFGAVFTQVAHGRTQSGFDAEWRIIELVTLDGDIWKRVDLFDESDLDAAVARFDELNRLTPRAANTASRVCERYRASFVARDWAAIGGMLAHDLHNEDRRRVVRAGIRRGPESALADLRAAADLGVPYFTATEIATRGERLALFRGGAPYDNRPGAFRVDTLQLAEIDADDRIITLVLFDPDEIDAAFAELDARYVLGEAAPYARTWSVVAGSYAAISRREFPALTVDCVTVDHRRVATFAPGELPAYIRAGWDIDQHITTHVEVVHRLSDRGAVVTYTAKGSSQEGFDGEWREIGLSIVDGDTINRCELFDETDLDAALARFDELNRPSPRLANTASRTVDRYVSYFAGRNWAAIAETLADDFCTIDNRRTVNSGSRYGRDAEITSLQAIAGLGAQSISSAVLATRGDRLALCRECISGAGEQSDVFRIEFLAVAEIDTDERMTARVAFDVDDLDTAFEELDARYLAGEAAPYAHAWSVVVAAFAAVSHNESPPSAPDWSYVDHRRGTPLAHSDLTRIIQDVKNITPDLRNCIEAVHRISGNGAVVTQFSHGSSPDGFEAEWRMLNLMTVAGDLLNRCELFDESELDAAIARFEELQSPPRRLENAASQVYDRFWDHFAAHKLDDMAEILAQNVRTDDRRRVVNAGAQRGRGFEMANIRSLAEIGAEVGRTVIATRGKALVLSRLWTSNSDFRHGEFAAEMLSLIEIDGDNRIVAGVLFEPDDLDAAFAELDARYLAGEAAAHAHTWSVIANANAAFNRREMPATTPDWVNVDHRRGGMAFAPGDQTAYMRATWDVASHISNRIVAVHRLSDLGVTFTQLVQATSREGFNAEWSDVVVMTLDGDMINHCEVFDEDELGDALARFDELN